MSNPTITEFLEARIAEDEDRARYLLKGLEDDIAANYADMVDERGLMTPTRKLHAELWATHDGQSKTRNFAKGQAIADFADPTRVLAECAAKRAIIELHNDREGDCEQCSDYGWFAALDGAYFHEEFPCPTLQSIAAVYASHPDYRQEWAL